MKLIVRKTGTIFDFCESSDGVEYDGIIYGGSSVKLSYTNDTLSVVVDGGETKKYDLTDLNYDNGSEIIGFASMLEFIDTLKTAGFTGNFNSGGATPQVKEIILKIDNTNAVTILKNTSGLNPTFTIANQGTGKDNLTSSLDLGLFEVWFLNQETNQNDLIELGNTKRLDCYRDDGNTIKIIKRSLDFSIDFINLDYNGNFILTDYNYNNTIIQIILNE